MVRRRLFAWFAGVLGVGVARATQPESLTSVANPDIEQLRQELSFLTARTDIDRRYHLLPIEQKYALKFIYEQQGILVKELAGKLEAIGIEETAKAIRRIRDSRFVVSGFGQVDNGFVTREHLYPAEDSMVRLQIEEWLRLVPKWRKPELGDFVFSYPNRPDTGGVIAGRRGPRGMVADVIE